MFISNVLSNIFMGILWMSNIFEIYILVVLLGLVDEQQKVRIIIVFVLVVLVEVVIFYGIEFFDSVLKFLWKGIR